MEFKDYYAVLGVERTATQDEIKRVYRKLARQYHPDISKEPNAEDRFKEIGEAYQVLGEPEKRAAYDKLGKGRRAGEEFQPPPDWDEGFEFSGATDAGFSDFFDALFGGRGQTHAFRDPAAFRARGADHHAKILIDLRDAFGGATRPISLRVPELDETGRATVRERQLNVEIPRGITAGQHIRLKGQGAPGSGGLLAGDLYLEVQFRPDPLYRAEGRNLYLDLPVAPWEAALGASVRTPTPSGPIMLKVPAGSFQGRELRVKGRGIPGEPPGDLYAVLRIALPAADSEKAKAIYESMAHELAFDPRAHLGD
jgi:curved DNA-binding protein